MFRYSKTLGKSKVSRIKSLLRSSGVPFRGATAIKRTSYCGDVQQVAFLKTSSVTKDLSDLGFSKSSQASISPDFTPFDASNATFEAIERSNVMNLWSLLEACLTAGYLDRAFSILQSLYDLPSHRAYFITDYNKYLFRCCQDFQSVEPMRKKLYSDLHNHFPKCNYDDRTLAILIHYAIRVSKNDTALKTDLTTFLCMTGGSVRSIMKNADVLTIQDYTKLCNDLKCVKLNELPEAVRSILEETMSSNDLVSAVEQQSTGLLHLKRENERHITATEGLQEDIKSVEKGVTELMSVKTFGMRAVRHSLLGLSISDEQRKKLNGLVVDPLLKTVVPEHTSIDFFEMYKSLKTDEERVAFDSFLEEFNHERQRDLENRSVDAAKERWRHEFEEAKTRGGLNIKKSLNVKLWEWYNGMYPLVREEVKRCKELVNLIDTKKPVQHSPKDKARMEYAPYLTLLNPEKMSVITILELLSLNSTGGVSEGMRTARAVMAIGKAVEMEFRSEALLKSENQMFKDVSKKSPEFKKLLQMAKTTFRNTKIEQSKVFWPYQIRAKIGSLLISMLINVARVEVTGIDPVTKEAVYGEAPAICHTFQYRTGSKIGVLKLHRSLTYQLGGERLNASVQPQHLPMLVKPRPWTSWNSGGYYYSQSTLIRSKDSPEQLAYIKAVTGKGAVNNIYQGLNVLGDTAWTVNKPLFTILSKIWNSGEEYLDIPPQEDDCQLPPKPPRESDPLELKRWRNDCRFKNIEYRGNRAMRCDSNYKLEIARAFLGEKFYFPHNMDFRGRAYPLAPHFNHLGNDMTRALLIFWQGKKLGEDGLNWLKVHLANLYGMDKKPFEDRIKFTEEHLEDIKDSAENPLHGNGWWKKADKPWQCLATCMELRDAYKLENPEDFISHQPVHQDGTCNGLQHYAALGGDIEGARQVNLVPSDRPQDVYAFVAKLVTERLTKAAAAGDEKAEQLKDMINRKVVKRTVMTNVYGVTFVGASQQIDKELREAFPDKNESYDMARYLTRHVFASIRELFHAAHLIQDWLAESAKKISKSVRLDLEIEKGKKLDSSLMMTSVIWTSPLGLPVVQPYRDIKKRQITTNLQTVFIADPFAVNPIDPRKQMAGLPPNFIHSLDASHMLLSAIECGSQGLQFAAVHDSYWSHACDISLMNKTLRNQFIKMHEVDLIQRLKNEFDERYKDYLEVRRIKKSSALALGITQLRQELSAKLGKPLTLADEIAMERERIQLLRSPNPEDQDRGKKMVTTVSFVEGEDYQDLEAPTGTLIMVPMKFPDIPPKGEFDVKELVHSKYFFS
ncbi:DNA-directed RNA polymerase Ecym_1514 [Eremothecium cymbalariae DBVPG|uniref:DNA-directed RNA polymerase n=1 Tax=Eremothecium cymbalariae (strain CBS 270.75 / DBVPG 7215 / KCTC 17166 / NRRL Y-17582) TaxID=931890 RepID=G8JMS2_ERECY|nr:hypothetical protein Ecym_1514 [Eremothecium cymbalariae DBVPG\